MSFKIQQEKDYWRGEFNAMASPCELLIETDDRSLAYSLTQLAFEEALRVEHKFSRYRQDNIIFKINNSHGKKVKVDEETALLLDYADQCFQISDGFFDITSGVLRGVWKFDGSDQVPGRNKVKTILPHIGWQKVYWNNPDFTLPDGMEIDLGGIGKEYAVDRTAMLIRAHTDSSVLINYGGDLYATKTKKDGTGWLIGIEKPNLNSLSKDTKSNHRNSIKEFQLKQGGIATSGDVYRYLLKDNIRYSHILDPHTGWPIKDAPHSVTVVAESCIEAGILATLAMLKGKSASKFLKEQQVKFWII
ncbi:MAG: FAD:protein FMN transferase [Gammaproteobacteria bacterium]|nr:FAD:protein FMN transferase [Gammaproteobacteria bacterium]